VARTYYDTRQALGFPLLAMAAGDRAV